MCLVGIVVILTMLFVSMVPKYDWPFNYFPIFIAGIILFCGAIGSYVEAFRPRVSHPQLTNEQIFYNVVDEVRKHQGGVIFLNIKKLMRRRHWSFSNSQDPIDTLALFGEETGLLEFGWDHYVVYPTPLAINPDDRMAATMLIANFSQIPDRDNPDIFMGGDVTTVNGLIEELRQLTPRGLELVRLHRSAMETVRNAKAS